MGLILSITAGGIVILILLGLIVVSSVAFFVYVFPTKLYFKCLFSEVDIPVSRLFAMKWKKFDANKIITPYLTAKRAGLNLSIDDFETHVLAGGNIDKVVKALISARGANLPLSLQTAMAIDLSGKDVYSVVQNCLVPQVFETPQVTAIAKDGIEVVASASITIKSNIKKILGGADEGTIIARIEEGLSSAIGSAVSHTAVIENPDVISDFLESKGYDKSSAYDIISIDIIKLTAGKDWNIQRSIEKAEADKKIAIARNEELKAQAIVAEQESKVKVQEMKAKVVECESEVPKALVKAIEGGKLSTMDYLDMQNLQADTKMRNALAENAMGGSPQPTFSNKNKKNPFDF